MPCGLYNPRKSDPDGGWLDNLVHVLFKYRRLMRKDVPSSRSLYSAFKSKYKITAFCKSTEKVHLLPVILEENTFSRKHVLYMLLVKHT